MTWHRQVLGYQQTQCWQLFSNTFDMGYNVGRGQSQLKTDRPPGFNNWKTFVEFNSSLKVPFLMTDYTNTLTVTPMSAF